MKQNLSIKQKIIAVVMLTNITVLALTITAFIAYELVTYRSSMVRNLSTLARAIADNSTASLAFGTSGTPRKSFFHCAPSRKWWPPLFTIQGQTVRDLSECGLCGRLSGDAAA